MPAENSSSAGQAAAATTLTVGVMAVAGPAQAAPKPVPAAAGSTNLSIAETPGVTCPGDAQCANIAAEPMIKAAPDDTFYGSSENGLGGGMIAVKSTDGGLHYTTLTSPNALSQTNDTGFAPSGGDTDLAVAPAKNPSGDYNVYVASLSLANVDVSTSADGGKTWAEDSQGQPPQGPRGQGVRVGYTLSRTDKRQSRNRPNRSG